MNTEKRPTRASLPKTALPRICFIDREIASGKFPNTQYLAEKYEGVSVSTIGRDIAFMKDQLGAPVEYDALRRGYYYSEPRYRIPGSFASAEDLLALGMAKNILSLYRDTPLYEAAGNLLDSITAPLAQDGKTDWIENRIVVPQVPSAAIPPETWNTIIEGLRENLIITFDYRGVWDEDFQSRRVRPYQLLFDNGLWFLYGFSEERKGIRMFSLSRIKNIAPSKNHFELPKDYDYRLASGGSHFGVFAGQKKYRFKIAFYDEAAVWARERQWADDQKIRETNDGLVIDFTSTQYNKVFEWMMSRGRAACPLEPERLVTDWRSHAEEMHRLAKHERKREK
jgi:predicted DNA-binding transcriptional regulator YafY